MDGDQDGFYSFPTRFSAWPPGQGSVSSSVTKAALDLGSLGREAPRTGGPVLSPRGAAPPPLGTQMGFIQQTKPPPPAGPLRHVDQASPWEGGDTQGRAAVAPNNFSLPQFSIFHQPGFSPEIPTPTHLHLEFSASISYLSPDSGLCTQPKPQSEAAQFLLGHENNLPTLPRGVSPPRKQMTNGGVPLRRLH